MFNCVPLIPYTVCFCTLQSFYSDYKFYLKLIFSSIPFIVSLKTLLIYAYSIVL
jgi:hypothetical protein